MEPWEHEDDERIEKLPKYAQQYITRLRRNLEERDTLISQMLGGPVEYNDRDDTKAYLQVGNDRHYRELPVGSRAIFPIEGGWAEVRSGDGGELHVMTNGQMSIMPQVSNVIRICGREHPARARRRSG